MEVSHSFSFLFFLQASSNRTVEFALDNDLSTVYHSIGSSAKEWVQVDLLLKHLVSKILILSNHYNFSLSSRGHFINY